MNIGMASAQSGVSAKMIRHYESIGLLRPAVRLENSYRDYGEREVHELRFIARARKLGFSIEEIRELLGLWQNRRRSSSSVKKITTAHLDDLEKRIFEMQQMAAVLRKLLNACHGDERPECPILGALEKPA